MYIFLCFSVDKVLASPSIIEVSLTVKQTFDVKNSKKDIDLTGTYELLRLDADSPMPENIQDDTYSFSLQGERAEVVIPLQFSQSGIYRYQLLDHKR